MTEPLATTAQWKINDHDIERIANDVGFLKTVVIIFLIFAVMDGCVNIINSEIGNAVYEGLADKKIEGDKS